MRGRKGAQLDKVCGGVEIKIDCSAIIIYLLLG